MHAAKQAGADIRIPIEAEIRQASRRAHPDQRKADRDRGQFWTKENHGDKLRGLPSNSLMSGCLE